MQRLRQNEPRTHPDDIRPKGSMLNSPPTRATSPDFLPHTSESTPNAAYLSVTPPYAPTSPAYAPSQSGGLGSPPLTFGSPTYEAGEAGEVVEGGSPTFTMTHNPLEGSPRPPDGPPPGGYAYEPESPTTGFEEYKAGGESETKPLSSDLSSFLTNLSSLLGSSASAAPSIFEPPPVLRYVHISPRKTPFPEADPSARSPTAPIVLATGNQRPRRSGTRSSSLEREKRAREARRVERWEREERERRERGGGRERRPLSAERDARWASGPPPLAAAPAPSPEPEPTASSSISIDEWRRAINSKVHTDRTRQVVVGGTY